jgi:Tol biopolymer transport system component
MNAHHGTGRIAALTAVVVVLASFVTLAPSAGATAPGPNGRIVFDTVFGFWNAGMPSQIYTILPDGSDMQQLTDMGDGSAAWHPAFSPTANRIVYVVSSEGNNDQIWIMRADGSHQRPLVDEPDWADSGPSFTAGGQRVLYSRCGPYVPPFYTCRIVSVALDGSHARAVVGGTWHPTDPVASPDGSTLAWASDAGGYEARIWLQDADGANRREIGPPVGFERPMWSPDGTQLVVTGYRTSTLYTIGADGNGFVEIAPGAIFGAWSPDGTRIVSAVDFGDGTTQLQTIAADGGDPIPLVDPSMYAGYSDWGVAR